MRDAFSALSSDALRQNNQSFLELARTSLGEFQQTARVELDGRHKAIEELVQPLKESLTLVDGKLQEVEQSRVGTAVGDHRAAAIPPRWRSRRCRSKPAGSCRRCARRTSAGNGASSSFAASSKRRACSSTATSISRSRSRRRRHAADAGHDRPAAGRQERRRRRQGPVVGLSRRDGDRDEAAARTAKLREHARQVRDHVVRLGNKTYWQHFQPAPDLVIMFVPGETLLSAALQHDPALLEFSLGRGVMLASPRR